MTQADWIQQVVRIAAYIATPLLLRWGLDEQNAAAVITGGAGLIGALSWWFFWSRKK